ncbi:unnamed protein product [Gulo gulo]|uniref:Uncharacterized protein n=1 Tax=Gulo gulo TaxID=48420 RepID=A0A9X9Q4T6_GULGU|nr:unnamed protein product [Gulo gulo]
MRNSDHKQALCLCQGCRTTLLAKLRNESLASSHVSGSRTQNTINNKHAVGNCIFQTCS